MTDPNYHLAGRALTAFPSAVGAGPHASNRDWVIWLVVVVVGCAIVIPLAVWWRRRSS